MKYLYYKAEKKYGEGLLDRRSCLMILLAEAKLCNRIAVIPKFKLGSQHNGGSSIESYLVGEYFNIEKLEVEYIFEEDFKKIEQSLEVREILYIESYKFNYSTNEALVVRQLKDDNFWNMKKLPEVFQLAYLFHGVGVRYVIPLVTPTKQIKEIGDQILARLEKPVLGLHLRRGDRLNRRLNNSMREEVLLKKIKPFDYSSAFYCTNDKKYQIENNAFFSSLNFNSLLSEINNNYLLFAIEMYIVDNCDISIRTFNDSSPFYYTKDNRSKNWSLCNYSMHGSNNSFVSIPEKLVKCEYDYDTVIKRKTFAKKSPIFPRIISGIMRKLIKTKS